MINIRIDTRTQALDLLDDTRLIKRYPVSTAKNGVGEQSGSYCTPRGKHLIRAMIGKGEPENMVFVRRRPSGELYSEELGEQFPDRDWILARILWLSGCEPGFNRLGEVDTMRRYIYIHGTPDVDALGTPVSHGCVRMRISDMIELFDQVHAGVVVEIL